MKKLYMNKSVYSATEKYPELIDFIVKIGFPQIKNSLLRKTMGKKFTLNEAIKLLNLDKVSIVKQLADYGFECIE